MISACPLGLLVLQNDAYTAEYLLLQQQQQQEVAGHGDGNDMELQAAQLPLRERQAESALLSWGMGDQRLGKSSSNKLSLSMRASDFDLKEFLVQRGKPS